MFGAGVRKSCIPSNDFACHVENKRAFRASIHPHLGRSSGSTAKKTTASSVFSGRLARFVLLLCDSNEASPGFEPHHL
ncbi:MAG: hypothetical protein D6741_16145 [Planctomycetota bacterium]|nr:MAG: hypothetical protein D6741_16145 [Planctomycetota bacterium]